jgi:hypothetical protein
MWRPVVMIQLAIQLSSPTLPSSTAKPYAEIIRAEAGKRKIDPYTFVAIATHESSWRASLVGGSAREPMIGLGQIRAKNYPACRAGLTTAGCKAQIAQLQSGAYNLRQMGSIITAWRKLCRRRTGKSALFARWLSGYQGTDLVRKTTCGQRKVKGRWVDVTPARITTHVMRYRKCLIRQVRRGARPNVRRPFVCWKIYGRA